MTADVIYRITVIWKMGKTRCADVKYGIDGTGSSANSHRGIGWEQFTDAAIRVLNEQDRPIVFLLWGRPAQMKHSMLNNPKHLILEAPHPSPYLHTEDFLGADISAKPMNFWSKMVLLLLTGR